VGTVKVLLDTHTLLWWLFDDRRLSRRVKAVLRAPENSIAVSSASAWEIATKYRLGRLDSAKPLVDDFPGWVAKAGFVELSILSGHAIRAGSWDVEHRDPFDRLLAAQSSMEELGLVSRDPIFASFGLEPIW
jgi:PIN domain nuclease of toxin-antitoxin system